MKFAARELEKDQEALFVSAYIDWLIGNLPQACSEAGRKRGRRPNATKEHLKSLEKLVTDQNLELLYVFDQIIAHYDAAATVQAIILFCQLHGFEVASVTMPRFIPWKNGTIDNRLQNKAVIVFQRKNSQTQPALIYRHAPQTSN